MNDTGDLGLALMNCNPWPGMRHEGYHGENLCLDVVIQ